MIEKRSIKISRGQLLTIGFLSLIAGIYAISSNFISTKKNEIFQTKNIQAYQNHQKQVEDVAVIKEIDEPKKNSTVSNNEKAAAEKKETDHQVVTTATTTEKKTTAQQYYLGILEIPKINLKAGFFDKNSSENTVEKNIMVLSTAAYPDVANGNFILAGHSGIGSIAYFEQLYQLSQGDIAYVTYKNVKYTYKLVDIYKQEKNGSVSIYRNMDKNVLTLITCTNDDRTTQTVYIAELQSKQNI